jgi:DNA-directed RNA polymerase subunit RPC12/RpoP
MGLNKSRPVYDKLRIDPQGRTHLIVTDLEAIPDDAIGAGLGLSNIKSWVVARAAPGIAAAPPGSRAFRSVADLRSHLSHHLAREPVGLRLYAVGTEAFLWDVANTARAAGMGSDEVFLSQAGSLRRRVYCTHCKSMNEEVTTSIATCRACGARLFVRDHFSRRLAAFMGVMVDAEVPGEIPEIEVLYP